MIRPVVNRSLTLALAVLMWGGSGALLHGQTLMQEPLGKTSEPKMTLFVTTLPPGYEAPMHQHGGVVFIYVLEAEIESQVEPNPPKIYHAGDFFHEPPMQVHRTFRNLSKTAPAKFLNFSNIATQNTGTQNASGVTARVLLQEALANLTEQEVCVIKITTAPGAPAAAAHQHPGPVFAYLLKGEVESHVEPGEPRVYRAGDVFYEPPLHIHRSYRNLSETNPAELLVFEVREKGQPLAVAPK